MFSPLAPAGEGCERSEQATGAFSSRRRPGEGDGDHGLGVHKKHPMTFEFCGKTVPAEPSDTIASALYRWGQRIFTRSFKYHRPRGLLCLSGKCPNCLMNVDGIPNVRACVTQVRAGMRVRQQNAFPSLEHDWLSMVQHFDRLMPVGWYYKSLTHRWTWKAAEPFIRKIAGLGDPPPPGTDNRGYEHCYKHTEVAIVGGGPAGLERAVELGLRGEQVTLIDDQPALGGHLRYSRGSTDLVELVGKLQGLPSVEVLQGCSCFGVYEGNLLGIVRPKSHAGAAEQLFHLRAGRIVVATGAYEAPLLFRNNDLVGIMLSTAVERLIRVHGIKPGTMATVIGRGERAEEVSTSLREAQIPIAAIIPPAAVVAARGSHHVQGIQTRDRYFNCDLVVVCGHRVPDAGLLTQAGGRLKWDSARGAFIPVDLPPDVTAIGGVTEGSAAESGLDPSQISSGKRTFVCLCSDVSSKDLQDAICEGFDHIEMLKRYTTATMGPCQGRMCQLSAISVCAHRTDRSIDEVGTTTARPPNPSVTLGALAGARHHPIRRTPMHYEHGALGSVWMDMGDWKRPRYYRTSTRPDERACVEEEYRAVRERVGLIDVSTLGKLDVKGRDTARLLDKVYAGRVSDLRPGRVRYAVLCDEAGIMLDDGTVSRLADDHYFITTTTGNLEFVEEWLKWWLVGTGWDVHITNLTGGLAALNLAGPRAREVLVKLTDCDLSTKAFSYMSCRHAEVGKVEALIMRIGFVGETGWEIHFPADCGVDLWRALLEAGREFDIRPFGVEAQRLLRLEKRHVIIGVDTDALTNPFEAGMGWVAKLEKEDFIGRASLRRLAREQPRQNLVGFVIDEDVVPEDGAAILVEGKLAGRITSVRYSPVNRKAVGMAWISAGLGREHAEVDVHIGSRLVRARITQNAFYDPEGARLRM
jgi:sarcosine oxidase, subunit alpha